MRGRLASNPAFAWLWAAHTVSLFGSLVTRTALPFTAILVLAASPVDMALLSATNLAAGFAASVVAAPWVDHLRRRPLMLGADLGRAAVLGLVPLAAAQGWLNLELLYAVGLASGALDTLFEVAQGAYVPALVGTEMLVPANARLAASASAAEVAAFAAGGWLVQWLGAPRAIAVDAATFLLSAGCLGRIAPSEPEPARRAPRQGLWHEASRGGAVLARDPLLRALSLADASAAFAFRAYSAVFLLFVTRELGCAPGVLGLVFAVGGLASFGGALAAGWAGHALGPTRTVAVGLGLLGAALLLVPLARDAAPAGIALLVAQQLIGDGAYTVATIHEVSLRQARIAPDLLGRANAAKRLLDTMAMLAGALAAGVLGEKLGLRWALALAAAVPILAALAFSRVTASARGRS